MEKTALIILLIMLVLVGCKGKPETGETEEATIEITPEAGYEETATGDTLPASPSMTALTKYQYTWSESDDMPPVCIIIDDFGQSAGQLLEDFGALPKEVAFAILPDLPHTRTASQMADKTGHEALIHAPMKPIGNENPGKRYIKPGMTQAEISEMLQDFFSQIPNAVAVNNHMGSGATADYNTMKLVVGEMRELGLFFVDSATTAKSAVPTVASELGMKTAKRDIFLDVPDNTDATLISKIQSLGKYKGRNEPVVIITHCHNRDKLVALQKFITQIEDMGIKLIPPSKLYNKLSPPA